ncbi:hypothetical protein J4453_01450 [Candidatus Woesearchaeota archaeon]|nr:hypothetical protein [Candidatus Woesearchaeota archaeon]
MTVCTIYPDFASIPFWIGMAASTAVLIGLLLYLPFKRIKSRKKYWFIPLFIVIMFVAFILNLFSFAMVDQCANLGKEVLVTDYQRVIASKEEAVALFRDYITAEAGLTNQSVIQDIVAEANKYMEEQDGKYVLHLYDTRYTIYKDGKFYSAWAGD